MQPNCDHTRENHPFAKCCLPSFFILKDSWKKNNLCIISTLTLLLNKLIKGDHNNCLLPFSSAGLNCYMELKLRPANIHLFITSVFAGHLEISCNQEACVLVKFIVKRMASTLDGQWFSHDE